MNIIKTFLGAKSSSVAVAMVLLLIVFNIGETLPASDVDVEIFDIYTFAKIEVLENLPVSSGIAEYDILIGNVPKIVGVISSPYGVRTHPHSQRRTFHRGIDMVAIRYSNVYPPASGIITFSGWKTGYGNVIIIDHLNGYESLMAHHNKNISKSGEFVTAETIIARVGQTGNATGPHMHVEIRYYGKLLNPKTFMD